MPDFVIDLTCLQCGERFPARIALLADNIEQPCPDCERRQRPQDFRDPLRGTWRRLRRWWLR